MKFSRHTDGPSCDGCNERLTQAHDSISDFYYFIKQKYHNVHCSWVYRGKEDQEKMFDEKSTFAHFGESKHNLLPAQAIDLFQINENGAAVFDGVFCAGINKLAKLNGFDLKWGGDFKKIGDSGHWELK